MPPDIFGRATAPAVRIKKHPGCTDAIAQDLGIVGAEVVVDPTTYQPILTLSLNTGIRTSAGPSRAWTAWNSGGTAATAKVSCN